MRLVIFFVLLFVLHTLSCKHGKDIGTIQFNNTEILEGSARLNCTKPNKTYSQKIERILQLEIDALNEIPKEKLSLSIDESAVRMFQHVNEGLDRDLLLFRICEMSINRGLTNTQTTELIKLVIKSWSTSVERIAPLLIIDAVKDTTVFFSVVNRCENELNITHIHLQHLTDSIWVNRPPGQSMKHIPRTKLGKIRVTNNSETTEILDYSQTIEIAPLKSLSFQFDFSIENDINPYGGEKVFVNWKNSMLIVDAISACFGDKIKIEKEIKIRRK